MRPSGIAAAAISALCFIAVGIMTIAILNHYERATSLSPSPLSAEANDKDGFPVIDWEFWLKANPDIIGWITIPGTNVDYPIVQAPRNDPGFYLTHDVWKEWNYMGCPYLDAECSDAGLIESKNAVVFAHNLGYNDESMFAHVAKFTDYEFARLHKRILLQTPSAKVAYHAKGACCIQGEEETKRTEFDSQDDLTSWLEERLEECSVRFGSAKTGSSRALTLCTCSYNYWSDERTLLFAIPAE